MPAFLGLAKQHFRYRAQHVRQASEPPCLGRRLSTLFFSAIPLKTCSAQTVIEDGSVPWLSWWVKNGREVSLKDQARSQNARDRKTAFWFKNN